MSVNGELNHKLYAQREENMKHLGFENEFGFYNAIASGSVEEIHAARERYKEATTSQTATQRNGVLSDDPVQNAKYHFVVLAAMTARVCVQNGLNHETSYNLSDIYINKMDKCTSIAAIDKLRDEMIFNYAELMKNTRKQNVYSKHIVRCIDYIYDHLNENITVSSLADYLQINPTYLSKLFAKETGLTLSKYIKRERLRAAANMLKFSEYSIGEISEYFCFSSQSHFTNAFQEQFYTTPKKYRDIYSNKHWNDVEP